MDSVELRKIGKAATSAARSLASLSGDVRNKAISNIADGLSSSRSEIVLENGRDIEKGRKKGLSEAVLDRLLLNDERIDVIARDALSVVGLSDPVGEIIEMNTMPNGLEVSRRRVPLGVIGVIYESRPNVTVDISALCLKSGNAVILRGGSEAFHSNTVLAGVIRAAILDAGISKDTVQIVGSTDRKFVSEMLKMDEFIDLMIPRGGADLVARVAKEASMPSITGGVGVCHTYVDESASLDMAVDIVFNAKVQRPSVCNALDTMLVHVSAAPEYLPKIANAFAEAGVEMRCDTRSMSILGSREDVKITPAALDHIKL